jgi:hypothetical protein
MLPAASLRLDQGSHGPCEVGRLDWPLGVVSVPHLEQLHDLTAIGIVGLDLASELVVRGIAARAPCIS